MGNSTGKHRALRQRTQSKEYSELEDKIQDQCETLHRLPLNFLKAITGDFSERQEIGRDRFGVVYKVYLDIYLSVFLLLFMPKYSIM